MDFLAISKILKLLVKGIAIRAKNGWSILKGGNIKQDLGYILAKVRTFGMQMQIIALAKVATLQQGKRYISRI
jgi:hypothetical protein